MNSDTPRTDEADKMRPITQGSYGSYNHILAHARTLERELNAVLLERSPHALAEKLKSCEAALNAALEDKRRFDWKPISTAPKGQLIDIWTVGFGNEPYRVCDCYYDHICDEWRTSRPTGHLFHIPIRYVTHWLSAKPSIPQ